MSNQVVIPFPGSRSSEWRSAPRSRFASRLSTARGVVRALIETLSYLGEARVRPPMPALPPARSAR